MKSILERRSIRKYTEDSVSDEVIKKLLAAAFAAPSAGNSQPRHYLVINDRAVLDKITEVHPHSQMLKQAPAAIMICAEPSAEKHPGYWVQDCSAATQNILIAAQELSLGSVWIGVYPKEERIAGLRELLGIPKEIMPFSIIAIGYPAEEKEPSQRYNPEKVHFNHW